MAFALTFCPGVGWLILKFQQNLSNLGFIIPIINMKYSIWRIFLLLCSSLSGIVTILLFFLPESPKFLLAQGRHDEALDILKQIHRRNRGEGKIYPVDRIHLDETLLLQENRNDSILKQIWNQTSPLFKSPLLKSTMKTSFMMFSLFASSSGFFMWTPLVLNKLLEFKDQNATVCNIVDKLILTEHQNSSEIETSCNVINVDVKIYEITFFMGSFFSLVYFLNGVIIYQVGKRNLLAFWFILCGLSGILIPYYSNYYVILFLMLIFLTSGCCGSLLSAILVDIFPTNVRAMSLCVVLMFGRLGAVAGSNFVSFMILNQCEMMFGIFGGTLLISAIISFILQEKNLSFI